MANTQSGNADEPSNDKMSKTNISPLRPNKDVERHWLKAYRTQVASAASSVAGHVVAYPMFSMIRRLQTVDSQVTFRHVVMNTYKQEGLRGFYNGAIQPFFAIMICRMSMFTVYQEAKYRTSEMIGRITGGPEPLLLVNTPGTLPTAGTMACFGIAGAVAGAATSVIGTPFELVTGTMVLAKRVASEGTPAKDFADKSNWATARSIIERGGGIRGLYTGWRLQCIRDAIGTTNYFLAYECSKQLLVHLSDTDDPTDRRTVAAAGAIGGAFGIITYPFDRAKSEYQYRRLMSGEGEQTPAPRIRDVKWLERSSWKGFNVAVARSALQHSIVFTVFEMTKKWVNRLPDPGREP